MHGEPIKKQAIKSYNPTRSDYAKKYAEMASETAMSVQEEEKIVSQKARSPLMPTKEKAPQIDDKEEIVRKLKAFRLEQSRQEKIKPYYIFNDAQMTDLIEKLPRTREELLKISGFGNVKVEKYGDKILEILH